MRSSFLPRLINPPFGDPGVFVQFLLDKRAILFDIGEIYALSNRDILKVSDVFVSHTHVDHFIGFDRLLRIHLGREKSLRIYGPPGFLENVRGKLAGYSWNLVENYPDRFVIHAAEVCPDHICTQTYDCHQRFSPQNPPGIAPFNDILLSEPGLNVSTAILDHNLPCLGFRMAEHFHVNILKDRLETLGLPTGPWLKRFKTALFEAQPPDTRIDIETSDGVKTFSLGDLSERIATITAGQVFVYVTDVRFTPENAEKIVRLAENADHLFIEAPFLQEHADLAAEKCHLTAHQAGTLAGQAGVKQMTIFHFSPRYEDDAAMLYAEADVAFRQAQDRPG